MSLKAKVEAIIYAAEEPITLEQISILLRDLVLAELASARENAAIEQADSAAEAATEAATVDDDAACESTQLPELESFAEELNGLETGPLMPRPERPEPAQVDYSRECEAFGVGDEPLFAMEAETSTAPPATGSIADGQDAASGEVAQEEAASDDAGVTGGGIGNVTGSVLGSVIGPNATARKRQPKKSEPEIADDKAVRARLRDILAELVADYSSEERGMEIRQIAGGFRMATKPQHHDVVRAFAKSLKPPIRLSLAALETLAVIAYKQPVTAPEIADIRGVESASVLGTLLDRKLITTAGRKQVIGRPMQYKTSKDFLLRFGLNDVNELPSMEEFSQLASDATIEIAPAEEPQTASLFPSDAEPDELQAPAAGSEAIPDRAPAAGSEAIPDAGAQESLPAEPQPEAAESAAAQNSAHDISANQPRSEAEPGHSPEAGSPAGQ